jgi:hypothetical protein
LTPAGYRATLAAARPTPTTDPDTEEPDMTPTHRYEILIDVAAAARDAGADDVLAAARRLLRADAAGWSTRRPGDVRIVLDAREALRA